MVVQVGQRVLVVVVLLDARRLELPLLPGYGLRLLRPPFPIRSRGLVLLPLQGGLQRGPVLSPRVQFSVEVRLPRLRTVDSNRSVGVRGGAESG